MTSGHDAPELAERLVELDDVYDYLEVTDTTGQAVDEDVIAEAHQELSRIIRPDP